MENLGAFRFVTLTWLIIAAAVVLLLFRLAAAWKVWKLNRTRPPRRTVDISSLNTPPPDVLLPAVSELQALGFQRLGESQVESREGQPVGRVWVFVNAEGTVSVDVVATVSQPLCGFTTIFGDGAVTQVYYPHGENIDDPDFVHHDNSVSIESAYRQHLEQVKAFSAAHGAPRLVRTIRDSLDIAELYRERYLQRLLWAGRRNKLLLPLIINVAVVVLLVGLLVVQYRFAPPLLSVVVAIIVIVAPLYLTLPGAPACRG